jgi:uncharacterized membrane protein
MLNRNEAERPAAMPRDKDIQTMSTRYTKPVWPLSLSELIQRRDECAKVESRFALIWTIFFFAVLFSNVFLAKRVESLKANHPWVEVIGIIGLFTFLILNAVFLIRSMKSRLKSFGLHCPSCDALLSRASIPLVIATGNCGGCGAKLLHDQPPR